MNSQEKINEVTKIVNAVKASLIPIKVIIITRLEGQDYKCGIQESFETLDKADTYMFFESFDAPEIGYYKFTVTVFWQDGREFTFRVDLNKTRNNNVSSALRSMKHYYLDKELPSAIAEGKHHKLGKQNLQELYDGYDIGVL